MMRDGDGGRFWRLGEIALCEVEMEFRFTGEGRGKIEDFVIGYCDGALFAK